MPAAIPLFIAIIAAVFVINALVLITGAAQSVESQIDANGNTLLTTAATTAAKVEIPVIDISKLNGGSPDEKRAVAIKIKAACEDVGFFVIRGHGVTDPVVYNMWSSTRAFFDQDTDYKLSFTRPQEEVFRCFLLWVVYDCNIIF